MDKKLFASRLLQLRGARSRNSVAAEMGIMSQTLERYEKGLRLPDIEIVSIIADFYKVSVDWLIGAEKTGTSDKEHIAFISDYTGLNNSTLDLLHEFYLHRKWCVDTLAELLFNDDFLHILSAINNLKSDSEMFREKWLNFVNNGQGAVNLSVNDLDIIRYSAIRLMENVLNCYDFRLDKDYYELEKRIADAIDVDLFDPKK